MARRTKADAQTTRNNLLDAAEQLFQSRGVSHTSLNDIATAAGTTRGAIYWHFKDKADLFNAMMERVTLPLEQTLTASTGNAATDGLVTRMRDFVFGANGVEGNITGRSKALEAAKKRNQSEQETMSLRLEQRQKNMLKQYEALDAKLGSMSSLNSFMTSQISQWNKS